MNEYKNVLNENENYNYIYIMNKYIIIKDCCKYIIDKCYCTRKCYNKCLDKFTNNEQVLEPLINQEPECEICDVKFISKQAFNDHLDRCHMNNGSVLITEL